MRKLTPLLMLALAPLSVIGSQAEAAAPATRSLTAPTTVLFDGCDSYPFRYNLGVPNAADDWSADVEIIGPDGRKVDTTFLFGDSAYDDSGSDDMFLCSAPTGRYRLRAEVTWYDSNYDDYEFSFSGKSFLVREPRSRTLMTGKRGSRLLFSVAVKDERPRGYYPSEEYTTVVLQQKKGAKWVRVGRSYLNERGRVSFTRPNGPGREVFRAKADFASYDDISDSYSKPVALR